MSGVNTKWLLSSDHWEPKSLVTNVYLLMDFFFTPPRHPFLPRVNLLFTDSSSHDRAVQIG